MSCHGRGVAQYEEFHPGSGDGHVHTAQVAQESYLPLIVGANQRNEYHVALLSLESVYRIHAYKVAEGFEKLMTAYLAAQLLYLCAIWGYDAAVYALL